MIIISRITLIEGISSSDSLFFHWCVRNFLFMSTHIDNFPRSHVIVLDFMDLFLNDICLDRSQFNFFLYVQLLSILPLYDRSHDIRVQIMLFILHIYVVSSKLKRTATGISNNRLDVTYIFYRIAEVGNLVWQDGSNSNLRFFGGVVDGVDFELLNFGEIVGVCFGDQLMRWDVSAGVFVVIGLAGKIHLFTHTITVMGSLVLLVHAASTFELKQYDKIINKFQIKIIKTHHQSSLSILSYIHHHFIIISMLFLFDVVRLIKG